MDRSRLWPNGPFYAGEAVQTDALVLASFAGAERAVRCADLGCGCGIIMLLLAWEHPVLQADGIECRAEAAAQAEENLRRNDLESRCRVFAGDWRDIVPDKNCYDLVISNPPYFAAGRGKTPPEAHRAAAREEQSTVAELCCCAARLLRSGGRFCAVYRAERAFELLSAMAEAGLQPRRLRCVQHRAEAAPSLLLCEGQKGYRGSLQWEAPLFITGTDGRETAEYLRICHWEGRNST